MAVTQNRTPHFSWMIADLLVRRDEVAAKLEGLQTKLEPIFVMFENEEALAKIQALSHQPEVLYEALQAFGVS